MKKWMGYAFIRLKGLDIERQIQKILKEGISLGGCKRESLTSFTAWVRPWHIRRIRRLGVNVSFIGKGGLATSLFAARKRIGLAVGALVWFAVILLIQGRVFRFSINGTDNNAVLDYVCEQVKLGSAVDGEKIEQLEREIIKNNDDIQWVSITAKGITLEITVKQKPSLPEPSPKEAGDIVASKVGLVQQITTLQGVPVATEGKLVLPGDVLISGQLIYAGEPADYIAAMGKCTAKVWYSAEKEVSLKREVRTQTGNTVTHKSLCILNTELDKKAPPFKHYSLTEIKKPIASIGIPIYTVERIYKEETVSWEDITPDQALQQYKAELEAELKDILPCEPIEISFYSSPTDNGAIVGVNAVTLEDIGVFVSR